MKYIIITVGKTHSGKTTFGKDMKEKLSDAIIFDSDELGDFLKTTYPWLYDEEILPMHTQERNRGGQLQIEVRLKILEQASKTQLPLIITAAHAHRSAREICRNMAKENGRIMILVYFNYSEEVLLERIKKSERNKVPLVFSKTYENLLLKKQKEKFETPTPDETDIFFEVTDEISLEQTKQKILNLIHSTS